MAKIRILIADDHKMFRDGIIALLKEEKEIEISGEAREGREVLDFLKDNPVDLVLMDVHMPEMNGIEATQKIKERYPKVEILGLTMSDEENHIIKMVEAGALGYIIKNTGRKELITAIKTIASGDSYFSKEVSQTIFNQLTEEKRGKSKKETGVPLTQREIDVLKLIAEEMTNLEIAEKLFISARTVDTHRRNLLQKLGVKNTAGLVRYAFKHKLVE